MNWMAKKGEKLMPFKTGKIMVYLFVIAIMAAGLLAGCASETGSGDALPGQSESSQQETAASGALTNQVNIIDAGWPSL